VTLSGGLVTSTVDNVVYALPYPVQAKPRLGEPEKAGIGVGSAIGALAAASIFYVLWRWRRRSGRDDDDDDDNAPPFPTNPSPGHNGYGSSGGGSNRISIP
jgi:hypothetical protein